MKEPGKLYQSARWTALSAGLRVVVRVLQLVIVARLLLPDEFGHFVMALAVLALVGPLADLGFGRSIVHHREIPASVLHSLYWTNVFAALLIGIVVLSLSPVAAWLFGDDTLGWVLACCSPQFLLAALGKQFRTLATKQHRFAELARNEIIALLVSFTVTVSMAAEGFGVYSLVAGVLAQRATSSLAAWIWLSAGCRPAFHFSLAEARPHLGYGGYVIGQRLVGSIHRRSDVFIGGWLVGSAGMGVYGIPRNLSMRLASAVVNPVINRIGFPRMAELQGDTGKLRRYFLATLQLTAALNYPIYVLLMLYATEFMLLVYGPRWSEAVFFLQVFCAVALLRSVGNPAALVFAVGQVRRLWRWQLLQLLIVPPVLIVAGLASGLEGVAWAMLGTQLLLVVPRWVMLVRPACAATLAEYLRPIIIPLVLCSVAGCAAWLATALLTHPAARVTVGTLVLGSLYLLLSYVFNRPLIDALARFSGLTRTPAANTPEILPPDSPRSIP